LHCHVTLTSSLFRQVVHFILAHCAPTEQSIPCGQCFRAPPTVSLSGWCLVKSHAFAPVPSLRVQRHADKHSPHAAANLIHLRYFTIILVDHRSYDIFPDHRNSLKWTLIARAVGKLSTRLRKWTAWTRYVILLLSMLLRENVYIIS